MSLMAPGKSHRNFISMVYLSRRFPIEMTANVWIIAHRFLLSGACA